MSYDEIKEMFRDALQQEEMMIKLYGELSGQTKNNTVIRILQRIITDEKEHARNVREILKILE